MRDWTRSSLEVSTVGSFLRFSGSLVFAGRVREARAGHADTDLRLHRIEPRSEELGLRLGELDGRGLVGLESIAPRAVRGLRRGEAPGRGVDVRDRVVERHHGFS